MTPAVGRLMQAVDSERHGDRGCSRADDCVRPRHRSDAGYMIEEDSTPETARPPASAASGQKTTRQSLPRRGRRLHHDAVHRAGSDSWRTSHTMDAVIQTASALLGRDFRREAPRRCQPGPDRLDAAGLAKL